MIGYSPNAYCLWCLEEHRIIQGHGVIFNESKFLFVDVSWNSVFNTDDTETGNWDEDKQIASDEGGATRINQEDRSHGISEEQQEILGSE